MDKIDVVMLTRNSVRQFKDPSMFETVLESIFENIPVNRLIIIDGYSTDETLNIVRQYTSHITQDKRGRGKGREIGIKMVKTGWFAFIDSNVIVGSNWFEKMKESIEPSVGAVHGLIIPDKYWINFYRSMAFLRRLNLEDYLFRYHQRIGMCMAILIRTDLVKDITIPQDLHVREDQYIREWIEKKNFCYVVNHKAKCLNQSRKHRSYKIKGLHDGIISRRYGYLSEKKVVLNALSAFPKALFSFLYSRDYVSARRHVEWNLYWLKGYYYEKYRNS